MIRFNSITADIYEKFLAVMPLSVAKYDNDPEYDANVIINSSYVLFFFTG